MASGRMLKKNVSVSRKLAELKSDSSRLLWTWLLAHLDIAGRFSGEPSVVKGSVVPRIKHFTEAKVQSILEELHHAGLLTLYQVGGESYLQFSRFEDFQNLRTDREGESKIPEPNEEMYNSGSTPGVSPAHSKSLKDKLKIDSISFNMENGAWSGIIEADRESWLKAYPACDIDLELARMIEWIKSNPAKGKKSNYRRFITSWLSRSQDRGGTRKGGPSGEYRASQVGRTPKREASADEIAATDAARERAVARARLRRRLMDDNREKMDTLNAAGNSVGVREIIDAIERQVEASGGGEL